MTRNWKGILLLTTLAPAVTGCLQRETRHSLYLAPDGAVAWTAIEMDVRSDETDPAKRRSEEQDYLAATATSSHGIGRGLRALGPTRLRTHVLRGERPFVVMSEAEFDRIDRMFERLLTDLRIPGYATLSHDGTRTTLVVHVSLETDAEDVNPSAVTGLFEDADRYRIVLTGGRFVSARGFELVDGGTAALPLEITPEQVAESGGVIEWALTWESASAPRR